MREHEKLILVLAVIRNLFARRSYVGVFMMDSSVHYVGAPNKFTNGASPVRLSDS